MRGLEAVKKWFASRHKAIDIVHNQPRLISICRKAGIHEQVETFEPLIEKYVKEIEMGGLTESGLYTRLTKDINVLSKKDAEVMKLVHSIAKNIRKEVKKEKKGEVATHPVVDQAGACMILARYFVKAFKEYDWLD